MMNSLGLGILLRRGTLLARSSFKTLPATLLMATALAVGGSVSRCAPKESARKGDRTATATATANAAALLDISSQSKSNTVSSSNGSKNSHHHRDDDDSGNDVGAVAELIKGLSIKISIGTLLGFCSGLALKTGFRIGAVGIGSVFVLIQVLQHYGYISIDISKVTADLEKTLDLDGDGKFDQNDVRMGFTWVLNVLKANLPSTSGFAVGFFFALTRG